MVILFLILLYTLLIFYLLFIGKLNVFSETFHEGFLSMFFLLIRIERLELFDEFEEWYMMQASGSLFLC